MGQAQKKLHPIYVLDLGGRLVYANQSAAELFALLEALDPTMYKAKTSDSNRMSFFDTADKHSGL